MNTSLSEQQLDYDKLAELIYHSRHYSGYTREAAVVELANYPTESSIDAILARVNDWVPVIRKQAQLSLVRLCQRSTIPFFVKRLDKLNHLKDCRRADHSEFVDQIGEKLIAHSEDALSQLSTANGMPALLYAKLLNKNLPLYKNALLDKNSSAEKKKLIDTSLNHSDAIVRRYAINLISKLEDSEREALLLYATKDKFGLVRSDALRSLLKYYPSSCRSICEDLLYDKEKTVRSQALFFLKNSDFDCIKEFSESLQKDDLHSQRIAIWGLTELFSKPSVNSIIPFLDSDHPRIRALALKACFVLAEESVLEQLFEKMLNDSSPRVVKECSRLYEKCYVRVTVEQFKSIITQQNEDKNYRFTLKMTQKINKWEQLILLSELSKTAPSALQN